MALCRRPRPTPGLATKTSESESASDVVGRMLTAAGTSGG